MEKKNFFTETVSLQELEATRRIVEAQRTSLQEKEEKYNKVLKTMKAARTRIDSLKSEKDQVCYYKSSLVMTTKVVSAVMNEQPIVVQDNTH